MSYQDFLDNYYCKKTNFLRYYQAISAIPKHLLTTARNKALIKNKLYLNNTFNFQLDESTQIDLIKTRTSDFTDYSTPRRTKQNIKVPKNGTTTFQQKRMCGKKVSPPSKLYAKNQSSKKFNLN